MSNEDPAGWSGTETAVNRRRLAAEARQSCRAEDSPRAEAERMYALLQDAAARGLDGPQLSDERQAENDDALLAFMASLAR